MFGILKFYILLAHQEYFDVVVWISEQTDRHYFPIQH